MTKEKVEKVKEFIEFTFDEISDTIDPCTCCHYERRRDNCEDCCSWDRLKESIISQFEYIFLDKDGSVKPIHVEETDMIYDYCPNCGNLVDDLFDNYCPKCGVKLDWSKEE